jgi:hypothetical protein
MSTARCAKVLESSQPTAHGTPRTCTRTPRKRAVMSACKHGFIEILPT